MLLLNDDDALHVRIIIKPVSKGSSSCFVHGFKTTTTIGAQAEEEKYISVHNVAPPTTPCLLSTIPSEEKPLFKYRSKLLCIINAPNDCSIVMYIPFVF